MIALVLKFVGVREKAESAGEALSQLPGATPSPASLSLCLRWHDWVGRPSSVAKEAHLPVTSGDHLREQNMSPQEYLHLRRMKVKPQLLLE